MILVPAVWVFMLVGLGVSLTYGSQFPAPSFSIDWERVGVSGVIVAVYGVLLAYVLYPYGKDLAQRLRSRKAQAANA